MSRFLFLAYLNQQHSHHFQSQNNILVDGSGRARLGDFGFTTIAGPDCTETSMYRFRGTYRWMAPELFNMGTGGKSGLSTRESDIFALGMVMLEVRNVHIGISSHGLKLSYLPPGVYRPSAILGV